MCPSMGAVCPPPSAVTDRPGAGKAHATVPPTYRSTAAISPIFASLARTTLRLNPSSLWLRWQCRQERRGTASSMCSDVFGQAHALVQDAHNAETVCDDAIDDDM